MRFNFSRGPLFFRDLLYFRRLFTGATGLALQPPSPACALITPDLSRLCIFPRKAHPIMAFAQPSHTLYTFMPNPAAAIVPVWHRQPLLTQTVLSPLHPPSTTHSPLSPYTFTIPYQTHLQTAGQDSQIHAQHQIQHMTSIHILPPLTQTEWQARYPRSKGNMAQSLPAPAPMGSSDPNYISLLPSCTLSCFSAYALSPTLRRVSNLFLPESPSAYACPPQSPQCPHASIMRRQLSTFQRSSPSIVRTAAAQHT